MSEWIVKLAISGPITIKNSLTLNVKKGHELPFWTQVKLKKASQGVWAEVIAKANTQNDANDAAVFFVGQMLDVLCLWTDLPLYVSLFDDQFRSYRNRVQRIVEESEWKRAFKLGREWEGVSP